MPGWRVRPWPSAWEMKSDLMFPIREDAPIAILTEKDPAALPVLRHSAAHILATAVREIFPTAGIGFKVVNTDATKFTIDAGGGIVWEKNPGSDVRTSGALSAGEKLEHALSATSTLKHATTALWKADDFADGLYTFSIGLATKVTETVQLSVDLLDTFKNKPPTAATKKNDVALVTSLAAKF